MRYASTDRVYGVTAVVGSLLARNVSAGVLTELAHDVYLARGELFAWIICVCAVSSLGLEYEICMYRPGLWRHSSGWEPPRAQHDGSAH